MGKRRFFISAGMFSWMLWGCLFLLSCQGSREEGSITAQEQIDSLGAINESQERVIMHLAARETNEYTLKALPLAGGSSVRIFYNEANGEIFTVVDSLARPDPNETYVVWCYDTDGVVFRLGAIDYTNKETPQPFGRVKNPHIFMVSKEILPLPDQPSPERVHCAFRMDQ